MKPSQRLFSENLPEDVDSDFIISQILPLRKFYEQIRFDFIHLLQICNIEIHKYNKFEIKNIPAY